MSAKDLLYDRCGTDINLIFINEKNLSSER